MGNELGLRPEGPLVGIRNFVEGALLDFELAQLLHQQGARLLVHARAGMADEAKGLALVEAEKQRAEMRAAAAGRGPAAYDHVQSLGGLQLDPILAASADVNAIDALADDAFEVLLPGQFKKVFAIFQNMIGKAKLRRWVDQAAQKILALEQGNFAQIVAIAIEQIEQIIGYRIARAQIGRGLLHVHALLHALEIAAAFFIENDDFAVQKRTPGADALGQGGQFRILVGDFIAGTREQADFAIFDPGERARAVPFHFEEPAGIGERTIDERGQHRRERSRHGGLSRSLEFGGLQARRDCASAAARRQFRRACGR